MFTNVLVGVDGRDGGRDALALAQDIGGPRARYVLANVVSGWISGRAGAFWLTAARRYAQTLLEEEERHHGAIKRMLNTSTAHRLAAAAHCPLLILSPTLSPEAVSPAGASRDPRALQAPTS
jgi:nucleotide-binding universal stress UspA family protein